MSDASNWSPFGKLQSRLPANFDGIALEALPTPVTYLVQADPVARDWRGAIDGGRLLELGPDRAFLVGAVDAAKVNQSLQGQGQVPLVDVTDARVWLAIDGPMAAAALGMWVTLNLSLTAFPTGAAKGAHFGPLAVLIERETATRFIVAGAVSSAEYLLEALLDAAKMASRTSSP